MNTNKLKIKKGFASEKYILPISSYLKEEINSSRSMFASKASKTYTSKSILKSLGL